MITRAITDIETNLNEKMVREGYAEVMYIPPSEFDSREWEG
jgi:endonuclease YncB( thermonuclease family)